MCSHRAERGARGAGLLVCEAWAVLQNPKVVGRVALTGSGGTSMGAWRGVGLHTGDANWEVGAGACVADALPGQIGAECCEIQVVSQKIVSLQTGAWGWEVGAYACWADA